MKVSEKNLGPSLVLRRMAKQRQVKNALSAIEAAGDITSELVPFYDGSVSDIRTALGCFAGNCISRSRITKRLLPTDLVSAHTVLTSGRYRQPHWSVAAVANDSSTAAEIDFESFKIFSPYLLEGAILKKYDAMPKKPKEISIAHFDTVKPHANYESYDTRKPLAEFFKNTLEHRNRLLGMVAIGNKEFGTIYFEKMVPILDKDSVQTAIQAITGESDEVVLFNCVNGIRWKDVFDSQPDHKHGTVISFLMRMGEQQAQLKDRQQKVMVR